MRAVVDGDGLIYRAAAATEKRWYEVDRWGHDTAKFDGKTGLKDAEAYCEEVGAEYDAIKSCRDAEPESHARHLLNVMMKNIKNSLDENGHHISDVIIGNSNGGGNFRFEVNPAYKANRPPRPINFQAVREQIMLRWGAWECDVNIETDDAVAMECDGNQALVVSQDKDFLQVVAPMFDWVNGKLTSAPSQEEADFNLAVQLLIGDSTDNIQANLRKLNRAEVDAVLQLLENKRSMASIARDMNISPSSIKTIKSKKNLDPLGYGDFGKVAATKYLNEHGGDPIKAAIEKYEHIHGDKGMAELTKVGTQVYLLRDMNDSFTRFLEVLA